MKVFAQARALMMARPLILAAALAAAATATPGCKSTSEVEMRMMLPPGASVMEIPEDEVFLMASPVSQPMPRYPEGVSRSGDVSTCIEMVVDESGAIRSATPLYGLPGCPAGPTSIDHRFINSSIEAVKRWQFLAAALCTFPPGTPVNDDCAGNGVVISPVAIKLAYVFFFHSSGRVSVRGRDG